MISGVRAGKRSFLQRIFFDPVTGILIIFLYILFWLMPLNLASWIGEKLSFLLSLILHKKNKVALYNLQKCFPEKTQEER